MRFGSKWRSKKKKKCRKEISYGKEMKKKNVERATRPALNGLER